MFTIGEFSMITHLSVKTLRYYHDEGILEPDHIEDDSGYRYYRESSIDKAMVIKMLRSLEFSINDIKDIVKNYSEDIEIMDFLESQQEKIKTKINTYKEMNLLISKMIERIRSNEMKDKGIFNIEEKTVDNIIFAGYRFKGKYTDEGKGFRIVSRAAGRHIAGRCMSLYYDEGYRENDADIESGFPVSKTVCTDNINCRIMKGGKAVTLIHNGTYDTIGRSYERIFKYINERNYRTILPGRQIYLKSPGIILHGNPDKFLTEIQIMIQ